MCGICGFYGDEQVETVKDMARAIKHRGPDSKGFHCTKDSGLGVRRLAIVDIDEGNQPISNEEENIWTVFNGEIYNFEKLRSELEDKDHCFSTDSDTEVIVHLYEEYGKDFVKKLNGMFAIAIKDERTGRMLIYRDRLGIKPVFYGQYEGVTYFASEIDSILETGIERKPSITGLSYFWHLRYIPSPYTAFKDIRKLEPGHFLELRDGKISKKRYWNLSQNNQTNPSNEEENIKRTKSLVVDAIKKRIPSNEEPAVLLSGGIDSSTIVAVMDELVDGQIKTFSAIFEEGDHDERRYSRIVSKEFNTDHKECLIDGNTVEKVEEIVKDFSNPIADPAIIPTQILCRETSKNTKVVATGTGSDEIFGGYNRYLKNINRYRSCHYFPKILKKYSRIVSSLLPNILRVQKYLNYFGKTTDHANIFNYSISEDESPFNHSLSLKNDVQRFFAEENDYLSKMTRFDIKYWLPSMLLAKIDHTSMDNSIEARVPFLDYRLVDFSRKIPSEQKIKHNNPKRLLKKAFEDHLPEEVVNKEIEGLSVPVGKWLKEDENPISDRFKEEKFEKLEFIDEKLIMEKYRDFKNGGDSCKRLLWKALVLQIWHEEYIQSN